jgi:hypothetical protein
MHAYEAGQASAATGTVSDRVSLDALVVVAARRLVLGADVLTAEQATQLFGGNGYTR